MHATFTSISGETLLKLRVKNVQHNVSFSPRKANLPLKTDFNFSSSITKVDRRAFLSCVEDYFAQQEAIKMPKKKRLRKKRIKKLLLEEF